MDHLLCSQTDPRGIGLYAAHRMKQINEGGMTPHFFDSYTLDLVGYWRLMGFEKTFLSS
jgi:hypothetical protein